MAGPIPLQTLSRSAQARVRALLRGDAPPQRSRRSSGGAKSRRVGAAFEQLIEISARSSRMDLVHLPASGAKFIGPGRAVAEPICCDFAGAVVGSGRGVFFDAKSSDEKEGGLALRNPHVVKPHQAEFIFRMDRAGAIAGILLELRTGFSFAEYRWLPGRLLGPARKTCKWTDPAWLVLGHDPRRLDFTRLIEAYRNKE